MRRDMDLVRELLMRIEALELPPGVNIVLDGCEPEVAVLDHEPESINHHLRMLVDGGLINGKISGYGVQMYGLSWQGHDFLDAVRSDTIWRRTRDGAQQAGGWTIGILRDLALAALKGEASRITGLHLS